MTCIFLIREDWAGSSTPFFRYGPSPFLGELARAVRLIRPGDVDRARRLAGGEVSLGRPGAFSSLPTIEFETLTVAGKVSVDSVTWGLTAGIWVSSSVIMFVVASSEAERISNLLF